MLFLTPLFPPSARTAPRGQRGLKRPTADFIDRFLRAVVATCLTFYDAAGGEPMINGIHALIYNKEAEKLRAFFSDVLGFRGVDAGQGWLIFCPAAR
jgi:hypothetical protein